MDLAYYPNIAAKAVELGGVKKTVFNKKLLEQADASWRQFSSEEIARIEQEAPSAVKVGNCFVTPTAILHMGRNQHALFAIPVRDVIWIYGNVTTTRMYYIFPVSKLFQVQLLTRSNQTYTQGHYLRLEPGHCQLCPGQLPGCRGHGGREERRVIYPCLINANPALPTVFCQQSRILV